MRRKRENMKRTMRTSHPILIMTSPNTSFDIILFFFITLKNLFQILFAIFRHYKKKKKKTLLTKVFQNYNLQVSP